MTRVALIATPYPLDEFPSPPLGLCYAAAAFEASGAEVIILDYIVREYTPEKLHHELSRFAPDIIGTSSVTMNVKKAWGILEDARQSCPNAVFVMAGPHVSFDIENSFASCPALDLIIRGEGEETIAEFLPLCNRPDAWHQIKGVAFKSPAGVVTTPARPFLENLDRLPLPARHLLPLARYKALGFPVSIITGRGCPNRCIFCLGRKMVGFKVRHRSTQKVADEMEHILGLGFSTINVADDLFTASKKRVLALCHEIEKRKLKLSWSVFSRVNTVDEEMLVAMKKAGCNSLSFGIESGNEEMLKRVKKGISLDQARRAAALCQKVGIRAHASYIAGLPGETRETLADSTALQQELPMEYGIHFLAPFPGTTVREEIESYDLTLHTDNWDLYDADRAIVSTSSLTAEEIDAAVQKVLKPFHDNWSHIQRRCQKGQATEEEQMMVLGNRRMKLIFQLLSKDLLEKLPPLPTDPAQAKKEAVKDLAKKTEETLSFTEFTLKDLMGKGWVRLHQKQGCTGLSWAEEPVHPDDRRLFQNSTSPEIVQV
ncbi:MAG: B12-binding domain-containing radical SAM protein [Desulfobacterales bacterium]|nr:B12-binding domain-containing radical SAM protein [Desulfobacterales bacterium]